jgi:hypothetical protein
MMTTDANELIAVEVHAKDRMAPWPVERKVGNVLNERRTCTPPSAQTDCWVKATW